jgi:hypothetical protein
MPVDRDTLLGRRQTLERQLKTHRKTLWHLEEQQAIYGISTPPHIAIGIEDEKETIRSLEAELAGLNSQLEQQPDTAGAESGAAPARSAAAPSRPSVFISYSHKDEAEKEELVAHLGVLQGEGLIDVWVDDRIAAGRDWAADIDQAIAQARVAILLVTKNFLSSRFILETEAPRLLERRTGEGLTVFPVIARPCAWRRVRWLAAMNVRPKNGAPIWREGGRYADEELAAIAEEVADLIDRAREI